MRSLLEKAILNLLNGDEEKAAALFHKFMVERARQIHESLRQNEGSDESLDEDWNSEITEEEYFGDDELGDEPEAPAMDGGDAMPPADDMAGDVADDAMPGDEAPVEDDGFGETEDGEFGDEAPGVEGKIDELSDKIDDLMAQFDRVMAEYGDDDDGIASDDSDDFSDSDLGDDDTLDMGDEAPAEDLGGESDDLAGRMEDDMGDEDETAPDHQMAEGEMPEFLKKGKGKDKDKEEVDEDDDFDDDDDLSDITESVLAELDKISAPSNTEGKGVGTSSSSSTTPNKVSPVPHHNVMDRIKGEPVMTKGPTHDGYNRETAPPVKGGETLVKNVRKANQRKSFKDTMSTVSNKGDASAILHSDFAGGPKPTKSIVDGKSSKG